MIAVYLIQASLFVLGFIPFLCEISKHFNDSIFNMLFRCTFFVATIICGYYAPSLQSLPELLLVLIAFILTYFSTVTLKDFVIIYQHKFIGG